MTIDRLMQAYCGTFLRLPEVASFCVPIGLRRDDAGERTQFQELVLAMQLRLQELVQPICVENKRHLLIDRGTTDVLAYSSFRDVNEESLLSWYDLVIHLQSVAVDFPDQYMLDERNHRNEDAAAARELDKRLGRIWSAHPCYHLVKSSREGFDHKYSAVVQILESCIPDLSSQMRR